MFNLGVGHIFCMEAMACIIDMYVVSRLWPTNLLSSKDSVFQGVLPFVLARSKYQGCLFGEKSRA